jgi:GT2 family glycosyltransferase
MKRCGIWVLNCDQNSKVWYVRAVRISILITCFNRIETTRNCLIKLASYSGTHILFITVVDGGSNDGTCEMIEDSFPNVKLIKESNVYWAEGMRIAWSNSLEDLSDYYLLLNDDLDLYEGSIDAALETLDAAHPKTILVGKVKEKSSENIIYGGLERFKKYTKLNFRLSESTSAVFSTFNANFVMIPSEIVGDIGILHQRFTHSMADIEYGLRATSRGVEIIQTSDFVGSSEYNYKWRHESNSFAIMGVRGILFHPKGLPIKEWLFLCRNYGGPLWPLNFIFRYLKMLGK